MLLRPQIADHARTFTGGNVGHAEKTYLQDIVLHSIYREVADELVFKGGTALNKLYNLDRFSEDLDFTSKGNPDLDRLLESVERHLNNFGARVERSEGKGNQRSYRARLGIRGPLYTGIDISLSFIRIEVNRVDRVEKPVTKRHTPNFPDIPAFDILAMTPEEILAEKIRAIMTRNQPRDLYDTYHLLHRGVGIEQKLVEKKLDYYNLEYDTHKILKEAQKNRKGWNSLESLTYSTLPDFQKALDILEASITKTK
jgi:predicted nucleotidyltransferase component of viral defense system